VLSFYFSCAGGDESLFQRPIAFHFHVREEEKVHQAMHGCFGNADWWTAIFWNRAVFASFPETKRTSTVGLTSTYGKSRPTSM
jgi:hypothetical protein